MPARVGDMPGTALCGIAADSAAGTEYDIIKSKLLLDGTLAGVKASHYAAACSLQPRPNLARSAPSATTCSSIFRRLGPML